MNSELGGRLDAAINVLPEDQNVAVILRDVQGLSNQEADDTLDVSLSTLKAGSTEGELPSATHLNPTSPSSPKPTRLGGSNRTVWSIHRLQLVVNPR